MGQKNDKPSPAFFDSLIYTRIDRFADCVTIDARNNRIKPSDETLTALAEIERLIADNEDRVVRGARIVAMKECLTALRRTWHSLKNTGAIENLIAAEEAKV